jgi:N-methylhydantoinase A
LFIVPRESSIFCAAGMLMSDLQHDFVCSFIAVFDRIDWAELSTQIAAMIEQGTALLAAEGIPPAERRYSLKLDCRYVKQYHEVSFPVAIETVQQGDGEAIASAFHVEHKRMYGYSLEEEGTPIELINVRVRAVGLTEKPSYAGEPRAESDAGSALKGERAVYLPGEQTPRYVPVYDGHKTRHGNHVPGPAIVEQVNTTLLLTPSYDCLCDEYGSFVVFQQGQQGRLSPKMQEMLP